MSKDLFKALWKSKCPKKISILSWILFNSYLNTADLLQRKLPTSCLLPPICCLCHAEGESLSHLLFGCSFSMACWYKLSNQQQPKNLSGWVMGYGLWLGQTKELHFSSKELQKLQRNCILVPAGANKRGLMVFQDVRHHELPQWYDIVHFEHKLS